MAGINKPAFGIAEHGIKADIRQPRRNRVKEQQQYLEDNLLHRQFNPCLLYTSIFIALILNKRAEFGVCLLLFIVAIGVFLSVRTSIIWGSYNVLLEQGDYTRPKKAVEKRIGGIYWGIVMAAYLLISFVTFRWESTWIIDVYKRQG